METVINIPRPCHENWDEMLPEQQGRHCLQCCKTVVDFTNWEQHDIISYLTTNNNHGVCGRFRTDQVLKPALKSTAEITEKIFFSRISYANKITALIILFFAITTTSCNDELIGKVKMSETSILQSATLGEPALVAKDAVDSNIIKGDTVLLPGSKIKCRSDQLPGKSKSQQ